jgi:DNA-binding MarR family transcriptional regulator
MPSTRTVPAADLLTALNLEARAFATHSVLFNQAVADRLGIGVTDLRCADIVGREGPVTAGRLAEVTGLTSGAITGVIDRLERAGIVRRGQDPSDRRRVMVALADRKREVAGLFASMGTSWEELCATYSEHELALVLDFMRRCGALLQSEAHNLRAGGPRRDAKPGPCAGSEPARRDPSQP